MVNFVMSKDVVDLIEVVVLALLSFLVKRRIPKPPKE